MNRACRRVCLAALLTACTPSVNVGQNNADFSLMQSTVIVPQDGKATSLQVSLTGDATGASLDLLPLHGLPPGLSQPTVDHQAGSATATMTFQANPDAPPTPGPYTITLSASNRATGAQGPVKSFTLEVAIVATIPGDTDKSKGVDGGLLEVPSTSLQPAEFQTAIPNVPALEALHPPHVHVQVYKTPWIGNTKQPGDWDFTLLDSFVQTLLGVGDGQPELQIYSAPPAALDSTGKYFNFTDEASVQVFAQYCANLVSYYNKGGFSYGGQTISNKNTNQTPIAWWGVLGDFNNADPNPADYAHIYNETVQMMTAVDPSIHVSALEFTDNASSAGTRPENYLAPIVPTTPDAGLTQRVDSVSVHMFATNHSTTPDAQLFSTVVGFGNDVKALRGILANSSLAGTPIWVTQANVNSDFPVNNGMSNSDMGQPFVKDPRGTGAFFAAWAPYMFSQLGQQGNSALYHWEYTAGHDVGDASQDLDIQNAEVNYDDGGTFLSYWVDMALAQTYGRGPSTPPPSILVSTTTEAPPATVDVLATKRADGTIVVMFSNIAVKDQTTANEPNKGVERTVVVNLSRAMPSIASAMNLTIDDTTSRTKGPAPYAMQVPADSRFPLTLAGYGVDFLTLTPGP